MRRKQVALVAPFAVAACFVAIRFVQLSFTLDALQKGVTPCFADLIIQSISGEGPISCSWFLAVGIECSMLSLLWERERSAQYLVLSGSWHRICAEELREAARVALGVGLAEFALICVSALIGVGASDLALLSFSGRSSYSAYKTGHVLGAEPSLGLVLVLCCAALLAICLFGAASFVFLRWLLGSSVAPLLIELLFGLTVAQGEYSFVYEIVRALGGTLDFVNPLYLLASLPSVAWGVWLEGSFWGIGLTVCLAVLFGAAAYAIAPHARLADRVPMRWSFFPNAVARK